MSQDFGINNPGSGFDFDSGEETDLDKLLDMASGAASFDGEDDSSMLFEAQVTDTEYYEEEEQQKPAQTWEIPEVEEVAVPSPSQRVQEYAQEAPEAVQEPQQVQPEPVYAPEPVTPQMPAHQPSPRRQFPDTVEQSQPAKIRPVNVKSEKDEISEAQRIINILDTYRGLQSEVKDVVSQFVGNDSIEDEASLVVKVVRADPMLYRTMTALKEAASETDRVERVFYILRLESDLLFSLGDLADSFNEGSITADRSDKIGFSKAVEDAINKMDRKIIDYVTATQTVLAASGNN